MSNSTQYRLWRHLHVGTSDRARDMRLFFVGWDQMVGGKGRWPQFKTADRRQPKVWKTLPAFLATAMEAKRMYDGGLTRKTELYVRITKNGNYVDVDLNTFLKSLFSKIAIDIPEEG